MSAWNANPVVVTCAITGADVFRDNNPNIPYTTEEIASSTIEAAAAGADTFVAGTAVFAADDPVAMVRRLRELASAPSP